MALLGKSNKSQSQRKAAFGAAVVLSSVVMLFMLGLYLMFSKMTVHERHSEIVQVSAPERIGEKIPTTVGDERNDLLLRRKMSVVAKNEEKEKENEKTSLQRRVQGIASAPPGVNILTANLDRNLNEKQNLNLNLNQPFNVSLWIDNTPSGGRKGEIIITVLPALAPLGARRLAELVDSRFFDGCRFFRVLHNFMGQFGINGDPAVQGQWRGKSIKDDPVKGTNKRGAVTFATSGPDR